MVVVLVTATIFVWGTVSARLQLADLTAPIVFTLVGALLAEFVLPVRALPRRLDTPRSPNPRDDKLRTANSERPADQWHLLDEEWVSS